MGKSANFLLPCCSCPIELSKKAILSLIVLLSNSHTFESRGGLRLCISMFISDYGDLDYYYV